MYDAEHEKAAHNLWPMYQRDHAEITAWVSFILEGPVPTSGLIERPERIGLEQFEEFARSAAAHWSHEHRVQLRQFLAWSPEEVHYEYYEMNMLQSSGQRLLTYLKSHAGIHFDLWPDSGWIPPTTLETAWMVDQHESSLKALAGAFSELPVDILQTAVENQRVRNELLAAVGEPLETEWPKGYFSKEDPSKPAS